jgi:hypothetical protein
MLGISHRPRFEPTHRLIGAQRRRRPVIRWPTDYHSHARSSKCLKSRGICMRTRSFVQFRCIRWGWRRGSQRPNPGSTGAVTERLGRGLEALPIGNRARGVDGWRAPSSVLTIDTIRCFRNALWDDQEPPAHLQPKTAISQEALSSPLALCGSRSATS